MNLAANPRTTATLELLLRAFAALGLGASTLLMWDYAQPAPTFCGVGQGCDSVRLSSYSSLLGMPTPLFGIIFFALALELALLSGERARRLLVPLGFAGGVMGLAFILLQAFVVHAFCVFCLVTDVGALAISVLAFVLRERPSVALDKRGWVAASAIMAVGFVAPFAYGAVHSTQAAHAPIASDSPTEVPDFVRREQAATPSVPTIVVFMDFECPHCRAEHFALTRLIDEFGSPVRIARKHTPLPTHRYAPLAARAAICAEGAGRGDLMVETLFSIDDLGEPAIYAAAERLGLDMPTFKGCLASATTTRRLEDDARDATAARVEGLPTFYIGDERFEGQQRDEAVLAALRQAAAAGKARVADEKH